MQKTGLLFLLFILIAYSSGWSQTKLDKNRIKADTIVCYGSEQVVKSFTPPPIDFLLKASKGNPRTADIIVSYNGFTPQAEAAFEYAVQIWEYLIVSDIPIYMEANWTALATNTLGSCAPSTYYLGLFVNGRQADAYYPVALAEKMSKEELSGASEPDLIANFNSTANWYYGTDGNTPGTQYDLVSIVLHEIAHGLGFVGTMNIGGGNMGSYGFTNGFTIVFDHFLEVEAEHKLTDPAYYPVPSAELGAALTGEKLTFSGPAELYETGNVRAKLWAPAEFDPGSSVYHLDEFRYSGADALMTPFVALGQAIHDPGTVTRGMMADWGWVHTYIEHESLKEREDLSEPVTINALISSDTMFYPDSSYIVYSYDEFTSSDSLVLIPTGLENEFEATIPVDIPDRTVSYYIRTVDYYNRIYTNPPEAPSLYYQFYIGPDTVKPVIEHFPVTFILFNKDSLNIKTAVTDNIGVDSVYLEYFFNDIAQDPLRIEHDSLDDYSTTIYFGIENLVPGDSIRYRILAIDSSQNANLAVLPEEDYFTVMIEDIRLEQDEYQNNFDTASNDFLMTGFSVITPGGFNDGALHTKHPYESPDQDNQDLEYIAQLKIPIILKSSDSYMRFDELVLVEPGEPGSSWGSDDFWDYVILEGSKDKGLSWQRFEAGYDSKKYSEWNTLYNSNVVDGNSLAMGTSGNYKTEMVNLLGSGWFHGGDTVLIRFRLYSDPYAHGWGWAIDNLEIQGTVSLVEENPLLNSSILVYPNPTGAILNIQLSDLPLSVQEIKISVLDILGREVRSLDSRSGPVFSETIDISDLPDGIYLVKFQTGKFHRLHKVLKAK